MQIKDVEKLKAWLLKRLSPLCDADPSALSKYIVALLRKEKPRAALKDLCINQLEVFLAKETPSFVDCLFLSLDNESYLSGSKDSSPTSPPTFQTKAPPTNKAGSESGMKGSSERIVIENRRPTDDTRHREVDDDDRDFRRARNRHGSPLMSSNVSGGDTSMADRGQRKRRTEVEPPKRSIRQRLGPKEDDHKNNRRPHPSRRRSKSRSRSRSRSSTPEYVSTSQEGNSNPTGGRKRPHTDTPSSQQQQQQATKRQRCKDYDERGMCLLGEQCPFDHGVDPVVITGPIPPPYPPPPPPPHHFPMGIPAPPHNLPNSTNGGLMLPSMMCQPPHISVSDGYNPEEPSLNAPSKVLAPPPPPPPSMHPSLIPMRPSFPSIPPPPPGLPSMNVPQPVPPNVPMNNNHLPNVGGARTGVVTAVVSGPKTSVGSVKTPFRLSDTLVLRKIPKDLNTITKLSGHFEKFGNIVNLQVRYENDPESAIVQFTNPQEAKKAHDATEAVLNNRFIKVYYLKNTGQTPYTPGQKENFLKTSTPEEVALQTIRPDVLNPSTDTTTTTMNETTPTTAQAPPTHPNSSTLMKPRTTTAHHFNHEEQHQQQEPTIHMKKQLAKQEAINNAAHKRLELQKKSQSLLEAQIKQQKLLLNKLEKSGSTLSTDEKAKVIETLKSLSSSITKLKETLSSASKTAQMKHRPPPHPTTGPVPPTNRNSSPDVNQSLQQTADQLRNEARQLGILPVVKGSSGQAPPTEDPSSSDLRNKLEGKPRQLLVINSVADKDMLVKYFESFGGLNQVEIDPQSDRNLIFTFRNRTIAEKAVQGSIFKGKPLIMKWYNPKPSPAVPAPAMAPSVPVTKPILSKEQEKPKLEPEEEQPIVKRTVTIDSDSDTYTVELTEEKNRPTSISNEIDIEGLLEGTDTEELDVLTPNQFKPRAVHLLDDDEDEEDRSWRR